jgi:hypothetical protein
MMKSTLIYSVLGLFFFFSQASASTVPEVPDAQWAGDTIPVTERFDEPLSGIAKQDKVRKSPFKQQAGDRKVIPLTNIELDTSYRDLLEIPEGYSGFKIEIILTSVPLPADHDIFFQHGNISMEQLGEEAYSYLIGHFDEEKGAEAFRKSLLQDRYPESIVIGYVDGQRQSTPAPKE